MKSKLLSTDTEKMTISFINRSKETLPQELNEGSSCAITRIPVHQGQRYSQRIQMCF